MSELNRENIIKALEYCGTSYSCNEKCPFVPNTHKGSLGCSEELMLTALALIKELIEENDRLKLSLSATTERSESRKEADISEILELRLKVNEFSEEIDRLIDKQRKEDEGK